MSIRLALSLLLLITGLLAACGVAPAAQTATTAKATSTPGPPTPTPGTPTYSATASGTRLPSPYEDSANLAAYPDRVSGLLGQVVERTGTRETPDASPLYCADVHYGYYQVQVERYLFDPLPYDAVQLRFWDASTHCTTPGFEMVPPYPVSLNPGERYVFFLSKLQAGSELPGEAGNTFTVQLAPPGYEGYFQISSGLVQTCHGGRCGASEPLADFEARIMQVAQEAGRRVPQ